MLIDTHCHIDFSTLRDEADEVIARAQAAGVERMINVGCDLESSFSSLALAEAHDFIFATFGVHPNDSDGWNDDVASQFLLKIKEGWKSGVKNVVAIGEIGLDYFRMGATKEVQQAAFRAQLKFAKQVQLPVVIHCRDAFDDTIRILEEESMESVAFHCFSGDLKTAQRIWANEWITSFTAVVSYPSNNPLRQIVAACPSALYFLETDAPFLAHQKIRGERNEPAFLSFLVESFAMLREMSDEQVIWQSGANANAFFLLPS